MGIMESPEPQPGQPGPSTMVGMGAVAPSTPNLDQLSAELERYEMILNKLTIAASPVLREHIRAEGPAVPGPEVREAPEHRVHGLIIDLGRLNNRLDSITEAIAF